MPPKARGEVGEAYFLAKAMSLGLAVLKPFGDSTKYDFVVDFDGRFARVQVKSAWTATGRNEHEYQFGASPARTDAAGTRPYRRNEIDFLVAYVVPEDVWYVIPVGVVVKRSHLMLNTRLGDRYARYREAWGLMGR